MIENYPSDFRAILFEETEEILECRLSRLYGFMFYQKKRHRFVQNVIMATYAYFHLFVNKISRTDTNSVRSFRPTSNWFLSRILQQLVTKLVITDQFGRYAS